MKRSPVRPPENMESLFYAAEFGIRTVRNSKSIRSCWGAGAEHAEQRNTGRDRETEKGCVRETAGDRKIERKGEALRTLHSG